MSNISEEEESQESIHQQPLHGSYAHTTAVGGLVAPATTKRRRSLPGNPDPDAEVIALSPRSLLATNRYICEVCHKGFQRDQNLQLHRRGHNLPWKLKQRASSEVRKRVYVCPEPNCVHHHPSRALGDLTGIKKHFSRKHGEKKWKCDKCSKRYAVQSDWKAHSKICGTKEYRCDCGTIFSRKDSFVTHRAFCDALVEPNYRANHGLAAVADEPAHCADTTTMTSTSVPHLGMNNPLRSLSVSPFAAGSSDSDFGTNTSRAPSFGFGGIAMGCLGSGTQPHGGHAAAAGSAYMSATALLQKAAEMGAKVSDDSISPILFRGFTGYHLNAASTSPFAEASGSVNAATDGSSYMGNHGVVAMNPQCTTFQQGGVANPPQVLHPDHEGPAKISSLQQGMHGNGQQEACGFPGRTTQDFLGLGPVGGVTTDGQSCRGSADGLGFSNGQQDEDDMVAPSYHQHRHLTPEQNRKTATDRPMWNY